MTDEPGHTTCDDCGRELDPEHDEVFDCEDCGGEICGECINAKDVCSECESDRLDEETE